MIATTASQMVVASALLTLLSSVQPAFSQCEGDCNGNGVVSIAELIRSVNVSLGTAPLSTCAGVDASGDGRVSIAELIRAVNRALEGCVLQPTPTPTSIVTTTPSPTRAIPSPTPTTGPSASPTSNEPPSIDGFTPTSGRVGTLVTITGQNFASIAAGPPSVIMSRQGGGVIDVPVTRFDDSTIIVTIPTGSESGPFSVSSGAQNATSAESFTVEVASIALTVSPNSVRVTRGHSAVFSVILDSPNNFTHYATLSVLGLPPGMVASIKPAHVTSGQQSLLTITAAGDQPVETHGLQIIAAARVDGVDVSAATAAAVAVHEVTTSFVGRTVIDDSIQTPLAGVTVTFLGQDGAGASNHCAAQTVSDAAGNFAFTNLPTECTGGQLIAYDGLTATNPPGQYAGVNLFYYIVPNQVTAAPVLIHLPRIDASESVCVQESAPTDQTFTFDTIPDLSLTVYAGTSFTRPEVMPAHDCPDGYFPLIAVQVPIDRLPDEMPIDSTTVVPFIVAFQPANAIASQPVAVTYPNTSNIRPGARTRLVTLNPMRGVMEDYGTGTISGDGTQIVPDLDPAHPGHRYGLVYFDWHGSATDPSNRPSPNQGDTAPPDLQTCPITAGNPIDVSSGIDVESTTDIAFGGQRGGIGIQRIYRTRSTFAGPFGIGTNHNYGYRLDTNNPQGSLMINLIMPNGSWFPLVRENLAIRSLRTQTIPGLRGVEMTVAADNSVSVRWKDGTLFRFVPSTVALGSLLESITDPNGNKITLIRNPVSSARITEIIDPVGRRLLLEYDGANRITTITDPIGRTVRYAYNARGTLETVTDPEGGVTRYDYDAQNRLTKVTDARGIVLAENRYDFNDRVAEQVQADGGIIRFDYTLANPLIANSPVLQTVVTDAMGHQTSYRFNPQGFLTDVTDAFGQTRTFEREPGTNLLLAIRGAGACGACGVSNAADESFTYDADGNLLTRTDALGNTTTFTYEPAFNRVASITDPLGHTTELNYGAGGRLQSIRDANGNVTSFSYDGFGLPTSATDPLGSQWQIDYDLFGNPTAVINPLGAKTSIAYDAVSRPYRFTDPLGRITTAQFDRLDRVVSATNAHGNVTQAAFDEVGNLVSVTDARGNTTGFDYDPMGRLSRETDSLGKADAREYDLNGNLIRFTDRRGMTSDYDYDSLNRLIREQYEDGAVVTRAYDSRGRLVEADDTQGGAFSFAYDPAGRLLASAGPFGAINYTRDQRGRVATRQVTGDPAVTYTYDPVGNLLAATMPEASISYTYDARNALLRQDYSNGVSSHYRHDAIGQVLSVVHRNTAEVLNTQTYGHNLAGDRIRVSNTLAQPLITQPSANAIDSQSNRLIQRGAVSYTYDDNGNRLVETNQAGTNRFTWDSRNRLESIERSGGERTTFLYDFAGNLLRHEVVSTVTPNTFVLDNLTNVAATNVGSRRLSILTTPQIDNHVAVVDNGSIEFGLTDALNSTILTTDPNGTIRSHFSYEPYGEKSSLEGDYPFRFTGRTLAGENVYYHRARYFDPLAGRFLSEDPLRQATDVQPSVKSARPLVPDPNLYRYALNTPTTLTDPTGEHPVVAAILTTASVVALRCIANPACFSLIRNLPQQLPLIPIRLQNLQEMLQRFRERQEELNSLPRGPLSEQLRRAEASVRCPMGGLLPGQGFLF